jgi:hypothetical protein
MGNNKFIKKQIEIKIPLSDFFCNYMIRYLYLFLEIVYSLKVVKKKLLLN